MPRTHNLAVKGRTKFLLGFAPLSLLEISLVALVAKGGRYIEAAVPTLFYILASAILYNRFIRGRRPKYPFAYPGGERDSYFPWSNIPRPIHEDVRDYPDFFRKKKRDKGGTGG